VAGRVIWFYLGKLFWPVDLIFIYPRWEVNPTVWWQYLFPLATVALLVLLSLIRWQWRGPLAGVLFFIGSLFPVLGFLNVYPFVFSFVADHFQYLASLGIIVVVSAGIAVALERVAPRARRAGQAFCIIVLVVLAALTWRQSRMYSDLQTLYETTLRSNPRCSMCHINLGVFLAAAGQGQAAIEHYEQVVRLRPNSGSAAVAHNNIGIALVQAGRVWEAINHYEQALRINPNYGYANYNMGIALQRAGLMSEATRHYKQALVINPNFAEAHNGLGNVLSLMGRSSEAREQYEAALRIRPDYAQARDNLSLLQGQQQKPVPKN
jgi:tetratricopeptide (TPR) repeat protein